MGSINYKSTKQARRSRMGGGRGAGLVTTTHTILPNLLGVGEGAQPCLPGISLVTAIAL